MANHNIHGLMLNTNDDFSKRFTCDLNLTNTYMVCMISAEQKIEQANLDF